MEHETKITTDDHDTVQGALKTERKSEKNKMEQEEVFMPLGTLSEAKYSLE